MPTFEYSAVDSAGQSEQGTVLGVTMADAVQNLARKGLRVERIHQAALLSDPLAQEPAFAPAAVGPAPGVREIPTGNPYDQPKEQPRTAKPEPAMPPRSYAQTSVVGPLVGRVPLDKLMFFFRQFGTMLNAGVPVVQSLDTLGGQARNEKLGEVIVEIRRQVSAGGPVSSGMQNYPEVFTPLYVSIVRAGEEAGFLPQALLQIADYIEQEIELRNLYKKATFMPKLTLIMSILLIGGANLLIGSMGKQSFLSSPLTNITTWLFLGPLLVGIFLFYRIGLPNPRVRYDYDGLVLRIPYVGHTMHQFAMAKFGRAFGALYRGGVAVPKAMKLAADACGNEYVRAQIYPATHRLESGAGITETLRSTNAFSPIVLDMVATGETTGNLDQMLTKMCEFYEDEAEVRSKQMGQVLGVVVMLIVAAYVCYILVQGYSGYFNNMFQQASEGTQ